VITTTLNVESTWKKYEVLEFTPKADIRDMDVRISPN